MLSIPEVRFVGHPFAPIGMGEHLRSAFRACQAAYLEPRIVDVFGHKQREDSNIEREFRPYLTDHLSDGINIFCLNGDEVEPALTALQARGSGRGYNIIYPAWELPNYPEIWAKQLDRFDEIWATSAYTFESFKSSVKKPVHRLPLPCEVTAQANITRRQFQIPESSYIFLFAFDFLSYLERKNPTAVVKAFDLLCRQAKHLDVALVIKTNNGDRKPEEFARFKELLRDTEGKCILINSLLCDAEMKGLVSLCDCFVSLHRAEGYGFGIAEAMALGRPTIATGYSGNLEFCNPVTSRLVNYKLIAVAPESYPHWKDQKWADPDISDAARHMKQLATDWKATLELGQAAKIFMRAKFSYLAAGEEYARRILSAPLLRP